MSGLFRQTGNIDHYEAGTQTTAGFAVRGSVASQTPVVCNLQPDTTDEILAENRRRGYISGKLYLPIGVAVDSESDTFTDSTSNTWEIVGPAVISANATAKWYPVERRVRT